MKFIKEAIAYYKNLKIEEKQRKRLLNTKLDYGALQLMIDNAENNPNLLIKITTKDGAHLEIVSQKRDKKTRFSDYINGEDDVLEIN